MTSVRSMDLPEFLLQKMKEWKKAQTEYPEWPGVRQLLLRKGIEPLNGASLRQQAYNVAAQLPMDTQKSLDSMDPPEAMWDYDLDGFLDENRPER